MSIAKGLDLSTHTGSSRLSSLNSGTPGSRVGLNSMDNAAQFDAAVSLASISSLKRSSGVLVPPTADTPAFGGL